MRRLGPARFGGQRVDHVQHAAPAIVPGRVEVGNIPATVYVHARQIHDAPTPGLSCGNELPDCRPPRLGVTAAGHKRYSMAGRLQSFGQRISKFTAIGEYQPAPGLAFAGTGRRSLHRLRRPSQRDTNREAARPAGGPTSRAGHPVQPHTFELRTTRPEASTS